MSRDDQYLLDILEAAKLALSYVSGQTLHEFLNDTECQDAVIRRFEIIGEAARRTSQETRERLSQLPWSEMTGMRNLLIHEYDGVDLTIVWHAVQHNLPPLISELERIFSSES